MTLLQLASFRSWNGEPVAKTLLKLGAPLDIHSACGLGRTDFLNQTLRSAAWALHDQVDTYLPIQFAISGGQFESVRTLIGFGDAPNRDLRKVGYFQWEDDLLHADNASWKPLHMAVLWGFNASRIPVAEALLDAGADANATSPLNGFRPIHLAAMPNRVEMIRVLVSRGANVNSLTETCPEIRLARSGENQSGQNAALLGPIRGNGCTPLMVAAGEGFIEATECLLEMNADPTLENDLGMTAIDFAKQHFHAGRPYDRIIDLITAARS